TFQVQVSLTLAATPGQVGNTRVHAANPATGEVADLILTTTVIAATPTPSASPTPTKTPTPSATTGPTATPRPACLTGRDAYDLKPRIQSWRAPRDGVYFILVRDTLNIGGGDRTYDIGVFGESYGPTPITIPEICRDLYEEDGLPEEATLMTSNEVEPLH